MLGDDILALTVSASFISRRELEEAKEIARLFMAQHEIIEADESDIENFTGNPPDRCYYCKTYLFSNIKELARSKGFEIVMDASNADDAGDYRPGMRALAELGIRSPLKEAGLTKAEIRELSRARGYANWDKPAAACLASRIPYGVEITKEKLMQVEKAEEFLESLGFEVCRVRHHGDIARIEVAPRKVEYVVEPKQRRKIVERLKALGFRYITVDAEGYRTGSLNESLDI